jgi:hypothetical protein
MCLNLEKHTKKKKKKKKTERKKKQDGTGKKPQRPSNSVKNPIVNTQICIRLVSHKGTKNKHTLEITVFAISGDVSTEYLHVISETFKVLEEN